VSHLFLLAAAVTVATFLVRLVLPFETDNEYVDLNMWEWPACAALFGLGLGLAISTSPTLMELTRLRSTIPRTNFSTAGICGVKSDTRTS
jgi:hypothetical protein